MSLTLDLNKWVLKTEARMEAVAKESFQRLINEAQQPVAKGGNMRVDTGFMRNSGIASINTLPIGKSINPFTKKNEAGEWDLNSQVAVINSLKIGQIIYFGWTANYAIHRENKDGFVRRATQNWPHIVDQVTKEAQK